MIYDEIAARNLYRRKSPDRRRGVSRIFYRDAAQVPSSIQEFNELYSRLGIHATDLFTASREP